MMSTNLNPTADNWVEVTMGPSKTKVWVNMAVATRLVPSHTDTIIYFDHENSITVNEEPRWILAGMGRIE
jgi:hypothetical protein